MHKHSHHPGTLASYQRVRTILVIFCVLFVILQVYILANVITHTITVFEDDTAALKKNEKKLEKNEEKFVNSLQDVLKEKLEIKDMDHHLKIGDDQNKQNINFKQGIGRATTSTPPKDDHHHHHHHEGAIIDRVELEKFLSAHPNVHTTPLFAARNSLKNPIPMPEEATRLLDLYSDIEPSHDDNEFIDEYLMKEKRIILRPETALLLKKVQSLNKKMREGHVSKKRVVIVHPVGQLCNRLVSISSAFVFAMLSKRALYVDFDSDFYCQASDLFLKPGFDWTNGGGGGGVGAHSQIDLSHEELFRDPVLENPEQGPWSMAEPLLCSNYSSHHHEQNNNNNHNHNQNNSPPSSFDETNPTIIIRTNQYLVPYIQRNKFYRKALEYFFPPANSYDNRSHGSSSSSSSDKNEVVNRFGGDVFHVMSHFLFRPLPQLLKERDAHIKTLNFRDYHVVGLQVRAGGDFTENSMTDKDWKLYADCGKATSFLSPSSSSSSSHSGGSESSKKKEIKYFVATDTAAGRIKAKQALGAANVFFGPGEFLLSNNPRGVQMALMDILLLEQANDRVATAWSTFGYFAAGRAGVPNNLISDQVPEDQVLLTGNNNNRNKNEIQRYMGIKHKSDKRRQCVRLPTVEPCFHHFENWGASKVSCAEENWLRDEMTGGRYC